MNCRQAVERLTKNLPHFQNDANKVLTLIEVLAFFEDHFLPRPLYQRYRRFLAPSCANAAQTCRDLADWLDKCEISNELESAASLRCQARIFDLQGEAPIPEVDVVKHEARLKLISQHCEALVQAMIDEQSQNLD